MLICALHRTNQDIQASQTEDELLPGRHSARTWPGPASVETIINHLIEFCVHTWTNEQLTLFFEREVCFARWTEYG